MAKFAGILCAISLCQAAGCTQNAESDAGAEKGDSLPAAVSETEADRLADAGKDGGKSWETEDSVEEDFQDANASGERSEESQKIDILETETPEEKTGRLRSEAPKAPAISPEEVADLSIQIHKAEHSLQLWDGETLIAEYAVGLAKNPVGAKEREGDNKNPEGAYYVCSKNSGSQYHLALGLSYPNAQDARRGYEEGLIDEAELDGLLRANENGEKPDWYTALGGEIMIHGQKGEQGGGSDWTRGCFAVDNEVMDLIWDYVEVGTKVTITPD